MLQSSRTTLVDTDNVNSDDHKLANTFNTFFKNVGRNLSIRKNINSLEVNSTTPHDPVNICILRYMNHPNIKLIWQSASFVNPFAILEITETYVANEILKLNPKIVGTFGNITTDSYKWFSDTFNLALKNTQNSKMLKK